MAKKYFYLGEHQENALYYCISTGFLEVRYGSKTSDKLRFLPTLPDVKALKYSSFELQYFDSAIIAYLRAISLGLIKHSR